jgi:hypothetical protein
MECSYSFKNTDHPCFVCKENQCNQKDPNENAKQNQKNRHGSNGGANSQGTNSSSWKAREKRDAVFKDSGKLVIFRMDCATRQAVAIKF